MRFARSTREPLLHTAKVIGQTIHLHQIVEREEARPQPIINIVIVIGDIVRHRRHLRLQRRPLVKLERKGCINFRQRPIGAGYGAIMFGHTLQHFPRQVQTGVVGIGAFQPRQCTHPLRIVIIATGMGHGLFQRLLTRMAKGWVANIMRQTQCFGQIFIQPQFARNYAANLRHFDTMRQPGAVMITIGRDEHLCLRPQTAKGDGMDDPVPIALEFAARPARTFPLFGKFASARGIRSGGVRGSIHAGQRLR